MNYYDEIHHHGYPDVFRLNTVMGIQHVVISTEHSGRKQLHVSLERLNTKVDNSMLVAQTLLPLTSHR